MRKILLAATLLTAASVSAWAQTGQLPSGWISGNSLSTAAPQKPNPVTAIFDRALGATRGAIIERGSAGWVMIGPGSTAGLPWVSNGAGADPAYQLLGLVGGGTGSNLSSTGGASQVLKQVSSGANVTVGQLAFTDISGSVSCSQEPARTGDTTAPAGSCVNTTVKVNGVSYGASPSINTIPVVTASGVVTYTAVPNCTVGALQYSTSTQLFSCVIGGTGTVTEQKNTASGGLVTSGNCDNTTTNSGSPCNYALTAARQTLPTIQKLTSGTAATYTTPANVLWLEVKMVGAGGSGAGGGTSATSGGNGGTTSFGLHSAPGGTGGTAGTQQGPLGGSGGTIGAGGIGREQPGCPGSSTLTALTGASFGGVGGCSMLGAGGQGANGVSTAGQAAPPNSGGGGGGGGGNNSQIAGPAGAGGDGLDIIIGSPVATYTYTIGAGTAGGPAGTNGSAGGAGGSGFIIVIEHYGS